MECLPLEARPRWTPCQLGQFGRAALIALALLALPAKLQAQSAAEAREALGRGDYARAEQLSRGAGDAASRLVLAELALARGAYDDASAAAESLVKTRGPGGGSRVASAAAIVAARAHLLRGRHDKARALLAPEVARNSWEAHGWLAEAETQAGRHAQALRLHQAVIQAYNQDAIKGDSARELLAVARATWALGAFKDANATLAAAAARDPGDIEIQLLWADLFLSKYDAPQAEQSLRLALSINPKDARAQERMARLAYEHRFDFADADKWLKGALETNPNLLAAHVTRAGMALRNHEIDAADAYLDAALAINPVDLEALSLRTAVRFVADDRAGMRTAERAVLAVDRRYSRLYSTIAAHAEWEHRYPELVQLADRALRLNPNDAEAHAARGLNLLRLGKERDGLVALHRAWSRDRYNVRVFNTLNLYEEVIAPSYEVFGKRRFRFRVHKQSRAVLEPFLPALANSAFESMRKRYGIAPKGPLWIEMYDSPEHFSVRTTGLPRIGVQGVCFGKVITALSPTAAEINWGQIVWHEIAHIFHIELSNNRVPRWFTEGLAEYETEIAGPNWKREDDEALLDALTRNELPPVARLNHAFTHARNQQAIMVAYYASSRLVAYLVETHGFAVVPKLLRLWAKGLTTEEVFERGLGLRLTDLDAGFRAHTLARLAPLAAQFRVNLDDYADLPERLEAATKRPSADSVGALAAARLLAGDLPAAARTAKRALALKGDSSVALWVIAEACFRARKFDESRAALEMLLAAGKDGRNLRILAARIAIRGKDYPTAKRHLKRAIALSPNDPESYAALSVVAEQTGETDLKRAMVLKLAELDQHSRGPLREGLSMLAEAREWKALAALAHSGTHVDPANPELHRLWARALLEGDQARAALEKAEHAAMLAKGGRREGQVLLTLARVLEANGHADRASQAAQQAVKLDPELWPQAADWLSR